MAKVINQMRLLRQNVNPLGQESSKALAGENTYNKNKKIIFNKNFWNKSKKNKKNFKS